MIAVSGDCYIEICEKNHAYSFSVERLEYDAYFGYYYWTPVDDGTKSLFDTKEKEIAEAKTVSSNL